MTQNTLGFLSLLIFLSTFGLSEIILNISLSKKFQCESFFEYNFFPLENHLMYLFITESQVGLRRKVSDIWNCITLYQEECQAGSHNTC